MAIEMIEEFSMGTQIKVIGVGGGGGNAVEHMIAQGVQGGQVVCANPDAQALNRSAAPRTGSWATSDNEVETMKRTHSLLHVQSAHGLAPPRAARRRRQQQRSVRHI